MGGNQIFLFSETYEIREKKYCLDATLPGVPVTLLDCHKEQGNQKWIYDPEVSENVPFVWIIYRQQTIIRENAFFQQTYEIRHNTGVNCLTIQDDSDVVTIAECDGSEYQRWMVHVAETKTDL